MTGFHPADDAFWAALDQLLATGRVVIDRSRGTAHPRYPDMIYPLDYGYLADTTAMDGGGIDVWAGSDPARGLDAVMVTVDLMKRDSEIKLLIGCTEEEKQLVWHQHNDSESMKGMLIRRPGACGQ